MHAIFYDPAPNRAGRFPRVQFRITNSQVLDRFVKLVDSQPVPGGGSALRCAGNSEVPDDLVSVFYSGGERARLTIDDCGVVSTSHDEAFDQSLSVERLLRRLALTQMSATDGPRHTQT